MDSNNGYDVFIAEEVILDSEDKAVGTAEDYNEGWFSDCDNNKPVGCRGLAAAAVDSLALAMCMLKGTKLYDTFCGLKPNESQLCKWGCPIWVHNTLGSKLDARAHKG
jgi:hypothetical protein